MFGGMTPQITIRLLWVAMLLALTGCAHQLQFRVVDASSEERLANVNVKVRQGSSFDYFRSVIPVHSVGLTDTNGLVVVPGVSSKDVVLFDKEGYRGAAAGFVGRGRVGFGPNPPLDVDTMWREQKVVESHGVISIPLLPKQR